MLRRLEKSTVNLDRISEETLEDLVKRAAISVTPDGFAGSSRLGDGSRGQSDVTPVEATMFAREAPPHDEVRKRVKHIEDLIRFIDVAANEIQSNVTEVYRQEEEKASRPVTSTACLVCEAAPATKAGYCASDYTIWQQHGAPDRLRWELFRKGSTSVDGFLMVSECPPPSGERLATRGPWKQTPQTDVTQDLTVDD